MSTKRDRRNVLEIKGSSTPARHVSIATGSGGYFLLAGVGIHQPPPAGTIAGDVDRLIEFLKQNRRRFSKFEIHGIEGGGVELELRP